MTNWTKRHDSQVAFKHGEGKTVQQIAREMKKPPYMVLDAHARQGLKARHEVKKPHQSNKGVARQHNPKERPEGIGPLEGANPVRDAEILLGNRLTWRGTIELLDGTPCDLDRKMIEANRMLYRDGAGRDRQLGKNPNWLWPRDRA